MCVCVCVCVYEDGQFLHTSDEGMARWARHFAEILNVQHDVNEDITHYLISEGKTPKITRDEVSIASKRLKRLKNK